MKNMVLGTGEVHPVL